jgi:hypothetical protein
MTFNGKLHEAQIAVQLDYGDRFLAKLALGFGSLLLDPSYIASSDAQRIRGFMWGKTQKQREAFRIRGTGFLDEGSRSLTELLGWKPGHVFLLIPTPIEDGVILTLHCNFYGAQAAFVEVSTDPAHWRERMGPDGLAFVIAPGFRKWVGPLPVTAYAMAKHRVAGARPEIIELMARCENPAPLPPFHIDAP